MKHIPDTVLAHYDAMPQLHARDFSSLNLQVFAKNVKTYITGDKVDAYGSPLTGYGAGAYQPIPDHEAVRFYLFNHLASLVRKQFTRHEPLPVWAREVMQGYKRILCEQGLRLTAYMAIITVRESRHLHEMTGGWWEAEINGKYGPGFATFHELIGKNADSGEMIQLLAEHAPATLMGNFYASVRTTFFEGTYGGSFGGAPWGNITKCLTQFIEGATTQEMMIDTAYTLAHNNGPMFNKGMLYAMYTPSFKTLLDVQRSGQIPEYIHEKHATSGDMSGLSVADWGVFLAFKDANPGVFAEYVDWYKVEADGALDKATCKTMQKLQDKKYGSKPIWVDGVKMKPAGQFEISPGVAVPMYERATA